MLHAVERMTIFAALSCKSVQRAGWCLIGELGDGVGDPAPVGDAVVVTVGRKLFGVHGAFVERFLAVAPEHETGGAPDIDLGYHGKTLPDPGLPIKGVWILLGGCRVGVSASGYTPREAIDPRETSSWPLFGIRSGWAGRDSSGLCDNRRRVGPGELIIRRAVQMTGFARRPIGRTGVQVTELGLGCATLAGSQIAVARAAAEEIVRPPGPPACAMSIPPHSMASAKPSALCR
jgi:hypothetical protein